MIQIEVRLGDKLSKRKTHLARDARAKTKGGFNALALLVAAVGGQAAQQGRGECIAATVAKLPGLLRTKE